MENKNITIRVRGIILNEGKMLVGKLTGNNFYCLLGGKLEWGEDLKEGLNRELIEELGVAPQIGRLLFVNTFIEKEGGQSIDFIFEVKNGKDYLDLENTERTHAFEISDLFWVSPGDDTYILPKTLNEYFKKGKIISNEVRYIRD